MAHKRLRAKKGSVGHRLTLRLQPELWRAIQIHAKRRGVPPAEWCRRSLAGACTDAGLLHLLEMGAE
jgi:hypothetical protein